MNQYKIYIEVSIKSILTDTVNFPEFSSLYKGSVAGSKCSSSNLPRSI